MRQRSELFREALDVDDVIAHLLVAEGFSSVEEVAFIDVAELTSIEGFDEDIALELQRRGQVFVEEQNRLAIERYKALGVTDDLASIEVLTPAMLVTLGEDDIKTLEDFAGLAGDELVELLGENVFTEEEANALIMQARVAAGWVTEEELAALAAEQEAEEEGAEPEVAPA